LVAFANGFVTFIVLADVAIYYAMVRKGYAQSMPNHVPLVSTFFIAACSYASFDMISRLGAPVTFRTLLGAIMAVTGIPAVVLVMSYLQKRRRETGT
jgi:uncharacterized membrane protein YoaK (UPF0700 family)